MPTIEPETSMIKLNVPDMSCGHCVATITKAVKAVDSAATVTADVAAKTVAIETSAPAADIAKAVDAAGYPNQAA